MQIFQDYAYYYNAFYWDKDYKAEAAQVDSLLKKYGSNIFNEKYIIAADYDWFVRNVRDRKNIEYVNITVCNFDRSGISSKSENLAILEKEVDDIIKRHLGILMLGVRWLMKLQNH